MEVYWTINFEDVQQREAQYSRFVVLWPELRRWVFGRFVAGNFVFFLHSFFCIAGKHEDKGFVAKKVCKPSFFYKDSVLKCMWRRPIDMNF
jgi:hypothetical protein